MARQTIQETNFRNNEERRTPNIYQDLEVILASMTIGSFGLAAVNVYRTYQETFEQSIDFFKDGMLVGGLCGAAVGLLYLYIK